MTVEDMEEMLLKHDADLYHGRGRSDPSITSRLLLLEIAIERFTTNTSKIVWLLVGTLVVGLANLVFHIK